MQKERCARTCEKDCQKGKRACQLKVPLIMAAIETPRRAVSAFGAIHEAGFVLTFPRNGGFFVEQRRA